LYNKTTDYIYDLGVIFDMIENTHRNYLDHNEIELFTYTQGDIDFHKHDFLEMVYVRNGQALHTLNDIETIVNKGDYYIIDYGVMHKYKMINEKTFDIINILFKPRLIDETLQNCNRFQDLINHYLIKVSYSVLEKNPTNIIYHDTDNSIFFIVNQMQEEFNNKGLGYIELMRCHLIEIILLTMRTISKKDIVVNNDISQYILDYIEKNYMNPITLSDISSYLDYSLSYISRKFKKDVGVTFVQYLQQKRMEQSGRLIANTDKKLSEIAELSGYCDIKFFYKIFKKHWGMTPKEFRKKHR